MTTPGIVVSDQTDRSALAGTDKLLVLGSDNEPYPLPQGPFNNHIWGLFAGTYIWRLGNQADLDRVENLLGTGLDPKQGIAFVTPTADWTHADTGNSLKVCLLYTSPSPRDS